MEKKTEARVYLVRLICDKCGGEMKSTGVSKLSYPVQYPHVCVNCDARMTVSGTVYPRIECEAINDDA